jgi:DNA-directed RNA polymerase specialized sigma24 family protein
MGQDETVGAMAEVSAIRYLSEDEVRERIHALGPADCVRIQRIGAIYARGTNWAPAELLQEAFLAALERRRWRADLSATVFLVGVMKSLAYSRRKSQRVSPLDLANKSADQGDSEVSNLGHESFNHDPARILEDEQQAQIVMAQLSAHFADDEEVLKVIRSRITGEDPAKLKAAMGLTQSQYETVCRRLLRGYQTKLRDTKS